MVGIGISELRLTSSRCSIGGENGRRGAGRRERRTEGAAKTKKVAGGMEGKRALGGFYQDLYTGPNAIFMYIYTYGGGARINVYVYRERYVYIYIHPVEGQFFL